MTYGSLRTPSTLRNCPTVRFCWSMAVIAHPSARLRTRPPVGNCMMLLVVCGSSPLPLRNISDRRSRSMQPKYPPRSCRDCFRRPHRRMSRPESWPWFHPAGSGSLKSRNPSCRLFPFHLCQRRAAGGKSAGRPSRQGRALIRRHAAGPVSSWTITASRPPRSASL